MLSLNDWRTQSYEKLLKLQKIDWPEPAPVASLQKQEISSAILPECQNGHLIFVDGHFVPALSQIPSDLVVLPLSSALQSFGLFLQNRWAKMLAQEKDPWVCLNGAFQGEGAFIYAPAGLHLEQPVQILQVFTSAKLSSPKLQISLGKGSSLSLIQTNLGSGFCNLHVDLTLDQEASLHWTEQVLFSEEATAFTSLNASLKKKSSFKAFYTTNGAKKVRFSPRIQLAEEESRAEIYALLMLTEKREASVHTLVEHVAPNTTSRQHVKPALHGQSRCNFEGKIFVRSEAQKTQAYQLNNNLLLSDEAVVQTKPNLEIFADDVKASHGATITQLRDEELFYLRSRGVNELAARLLLIEGFCLELISHAPIQSVRNHLLQVMKSLWK